MEVPMRRERSKTHSAAQEPRRDRVGREHDAGPYHPGRKFPEPTACSDCGALYLDGRWTWRSAPADAHRTRCPACQRIHDGYPAGIVTARGAFAQAHADEIQSLARHVEEREKVEHPLKRIARVESQGDALVISTTDAKLARGIGEALRSAYHGELQMSFPDDEGDVLRVSWER
jgi:NMD protein affecting ribosome stability and mRNA decay